MNASATTATLTTEELFALPEDGIERDIIRGELKEYPVTKRNRLHSKVLISVGRILGSWVIAQHNGGEVTGGEAGVRLRAEPETTVGIDVAYFSAESIAKMPVDQAFYEGPPVLAVEILSPSDTHESVVQKVTLYLECGVPVVWIIDPDFQTLTIHRPNTEPQMLRVHETLDGNPELPHLKVSVRDFFN
jgi:Uma2 family endonuclease